MKIACMPNGPYYLIHDSTPQPVPGLVRQSSGICTSVRGIALCRCGGSRNKPFCDGTHSTNGFTDAHRADRSKDRRVAYVGKHITIFDNRALCAHAGHCTDGLRQVFRQKQEPWIDPDAATARQIADTIRRCPSGALSYELGGEEAMPPERAPTVLVTNDGPYAVSGGVELSGVEFGDGASTEHYTLCRCGASKNKPFCDGSHWHVGFKDPSRRAR